MTTSIKTTEGRVTVVDGDSRLEAQLQMKGWAHAKDVASGAVVTVQKVNGELQIIQVHEHWNLLKSSTEQKRQKRDRDSKNCKPWYRSYAR